MIDNDDIALMETDIRGRLSGLPFTVVNRSVEDFPCFLLIREYEGGETAEIGFVGLAYDSKHWYGASYADYRMSDPFDTLIPCLSWVLNKHLSHILGV